MFRERLTRADLLIVVLSVVLGGLGVFIAMRGFDAAFPEASIEFKVSRPQIEQRARDFLERRGFDLSSFPHQLVVFRYDDTAGEPGPFYILEVNTQPGMTPLSLVPEVAAHAGIDFPQLVSWIVEDASCSR